MTNDIQMLILRTDMSDEDLRSIIGKCSALAKSTSTPFYLTIHGYDNDPRDLWNIPEAKALMGRGCILGLLSALEVGQPDLPLAPGLTAFHVWLIVTGQMREDGTAVVDRDVYNQCYGAVLLSNAIADAIPPDDRDIFMLRKGP